MRIYQKLLSMSLSVVGVLLLLGCNSSTSTAIRVTSATKDEDVRAVIISHTPIGTSATNVLKYVVDELRAGQETSSYYKYVNALETNRPVRTGVVRVDPGRPLILPEGSSWEQPHEIYTVLGAFRDGRLPCRLAACWKFDQDDRLAEITIRRDHSP